MPELAVVPAGRGLGIPKAANGAIRRQMKTYSMGKRRIREQGIVGKRQLLI
jgi:hypothetical protein